MIANWIHVMIVHLAVIGTPWLLYRIWIARKLPMDGVAWKVNFSGLLILGVIASVAYFTGPRAADWTKEILDNYPQDLVENHALLGRVALVIQVIGALLGVMGWASILQEEKPDKRISTVLLLLLGVNTAVILYTAHLGGLIRRMDLMF
jgi:hypothetical protein